MRYVVSHFEEDVERAVVVGTYESAEEMYKAMVPMFVEDEDIKAHYEYQVSHPIADEDFTLEEYIAELLYYDEIDHYIVEEIIEDSDIAEY